jgi:nucleotide-binding universal stress UspA family protein
MFVGDKALIGKILVVVDGSENSNRALDFALDIAEKYGASVTVLNVRESPGMGAVPMEPTTVSGESMVMFGKDLLRLHEEILRKAVAHSKIVKPEMAVFSKLREGDPASEIVALAKEEGFDLVVVGHEGAGRVKEFFGLGGISEKVVHLAPCSVVIVR